jgi:hypothetical protein
VEKRGLPTGFDPTWVLTVYFGTQNMFITLWFGFDSLRDKTGFGNGRRSPSVTGNALVTDQVLQISQES